MQFSPGVIYFHLMKEKRETDPYYTPPEKLKPIIPYRSNEEAKLTNQNLILFSNKLLPCSDIYVRKGYFRKVLQDSLDKEIANQRSQSDDAEKAFIGKRKQEFGSQFTTKLEGMFTDMSRETNESFET